MNTFKYRIYYKYLGPSKKEDPFALKPLSPDQVQHYLDGLRSNLPNDYSVTTKDNSLFVAVATNDSEQDTNTVLRQYVVNLNSATCGLSLFIEKLSE